MLSYRDSFGTHCDAGYLPASDISLHAAFFCPGMKGPVQKVHRNVLSSAWLNGYMGTQPDRAAAPIYYR